MGSEKRHFPRQASTQVEYEMPPRPRRESLESAATLVDLGAVLYGMVAVLVERGVRMVFWALDERRKWREKRREEAMAEGQAELIAERLAEGIPQTEQELEQWAREKGISLDRQPRK